MTRSFSTAPLRPGLIDDLLDSARRGPSAGNTQATGFVVLDRPELVQAYWDTTLPEPKRSSFRWQSMLEAPALVLVTTTPDAYVDRYAESDKARPGLGDNIEGWPVPFWWVDAGAVVQNVLLLAVEAELGACLFGVFAHEAAVADRFDLADGERIVATIAIGEPLPDSPGRSAKRPRPPISSVIRRPVD